jgi:hypothetical protein
MLSVAPGSPIHSTSSAMLARLSALFLFAEPITYQLDTEKANGVGLIVGIVSNYGQHAVPGIVPRISRLGPCS